MSGFLFLGNRQHQENRPQEGGRKPPLQNPRKGDIVDEPARFQVKRMFCRTTESTARNGCATRVVEVVMCSGERCFRHFLGFVIVDVGGEHIGPRDGNYGQWQP